MENSFPEWSERECRVVRVGQIQVHQIRLGVKGETSRRQSKHAESGVYYGRQVLSENRETLPEPGGKGLRTGRAGALQGKT